MRNGCWRAMRKRGAGGRTHLELYGLATGPFLWIPTLLSTCPSFTGRTRQGKKCPQKGMGAQLGQQCGSPESPSLTSAALTAGFPRAQPPVHARPCQQKNLRPALGNLFRGGTEAAAKSKILEMHWHQATKEPNRLKDKSGPNTYILYHFSSSLSEAVIV